jgi:hypothetical protein
VSFFAEGMAAPDSDEKRQPYRRQPSWRGPSEDEVGRPLPISFVLGRTDAVAIVVQAVRAYSDGCLFDVEWALRRTDEDAARWAEVEDAAHGHRHIRQGGTDALLFGVEFSNGTAARTTDRWDRRDPDDGPHIVQTGGSGSSGGTERIHGTMQLWLHPLPHAPYMSLVCAWPRFGLNEARQTIDTSAIQSAAQEARLIWPEDATLSLETDN